MDSLPAPPPSHADLLERPLFAHLATIRPDGSPQSSVMWFAWDGSRLRMTHTKNRHKFANLQHEVRVALSVADPDDEYRSLEVRGVVEAIDDDDADASFYRSLRARYGRAEGAVRHQSVRVVVTIRPHTFVAVTGGAIQIPKGSWRSRRAIGRAARHRFGGPARWPIR